MPEDQKTCAEHGERQVIGYDWQETLEVVPPKLVVRRTGIPKLARPKAPECGVVESPRPAGLVEGNRYDTSVAAEIMVAKYAYHVPVNRQQDLFASHGWTPARSALLNVLEAAAHLVRPLVAPLREVVLAGPTIDTDDTTGTHVVDRLYLLRGTYGCGGSSRGKCRSRIASPCVGHAQLPILHGSRLGWHQDSGRITISLQWGLRETIFRRGSTGMASAAVVTSHHRLLMPATASIPKQLLRLRRLLVSLLATLCVTAVVVPTRLAYPQTTTWGVPTGADLADAWQRRFRTISPTRSVVNMITIGSGRNGLEPRKIHQRRRGSPQ